MSNSLSKVHPELISEWSDKNYPLTPDNITFGSNKIVWWKGSCGHEWQASVKSRSSGENCPICSGKRVATGINDLATLKPELVKEWSDKNTLKPTEVTVGSHKKIIWKCKLGHEWQATVKSRTLNGTGCPYCSHNSILAGFNDLASQFPDVAAEWSARNKLKPTEVTAFSNQKVWWKCSKLNSINDTIFTRLYDFTRAIAYFYFQKAFYWVIYGLCVSCKVLISNARCISSVIPNDNTFTLRVLLFGCDSYRITRSSCRCNPKLIAIYCELHIGMIRAELVIAKHFVCIPSHRLQNQNI